MYKANYCCSKNRLYISISGKLVGQEALEYKKNILHLLHMVSPNFTISIDMRQAHFDMFYNSSQFSEIREFAVSKQLFSTIHIVSDYVLLLHKKKPFSGIQNICTNTEFAESFLNNKIRKGSRNV